MSSKDIHYTYCKHSVEGASSLIRDIRGGHFPDPGDIRLRRHKDGVVRRSLFEELRRAFLTPIDRDDLWQMCTKTAHVFTKAEDIVLELWRQGWTRLPEDSLWVSLQDTCDDLVKAVEAFPLSRRREEVPARIASLEKHAGEAEKVYSRQLRRVWSGTSPLPLLRLCDTAMNAVASCEDAAEHLLLALLRNE